MIASLRTDGEIKTILCNTIRELPVTLHEIKRETFNDEYIDLTKTKITEKDQHISSNFSPCDEVLMYSERVIIPQKLQKRILKYFHVGHPGKNRMKSLMRSYVYWPKMDQDIVNIVSTCKC